MKSTTKTGRTASPPRDLHGDTFWHTAAHKMASQDFKALIDQVSTEEIDAALALQNEDGNTVLHMAIRNQDENILKALLEKASQEAICAALAKENRARMTIFSLLTPGDGRVSIANYRLLVEKGMEYILSPKGMSHIQEIEKKSHIFRLSRGFPTYNEEAVNPTYLQSDKFLFLMQAVNLVRTVNKYVRTDLPKLIAYCKEHIPEDPEKILFSQAEFLLKRLTDAEKIAKTEELKNQLHVLQGQVHWLLYLKHLKAARLGKADEKFHNERSKHHFDLAEKNYTRITSPDGLSTFNALLVMDFSKKTAFKSEQDGGLLKSVSDIQSSLKQLEVLHQAVIERQKDIATVELKYEGQAKLIENLEKTLLKRKMLSEGQEKVFDFSGRESKSPSSGIQKIQSKIEEVKSQLQITERELDTMKARHQDDVVLLRASAKSFAAISQETDKETDKKADSLDAVAYGWDKNDEELYQAACKILSTNLHHKQMRIDGLVKKERFSTSLRKHIGSLFSPKPSGHSSSVEPEQKPLRRKKTDYRP